MPTMYHLTDGVRRATDKFFSPVSHGFFLSCFLIFRSLSPRRSSRGDQKLTPGTTPDQDAHDTLLIDDDWSGDHVFREAFQHVSHL